MLVYSLSNVDFFFFKQKTAYEMRISDWSSDVCSSDLIDAEPAPRAAVSVEDSGNPLLQAHRLAFSYPTRRRSWLQREARPVQRALAELSFRIARGETLGLVGESEIGRASCRGRVWPSV